MPSFVGLRVVRGPDWKWGDQDGGEGNVGTVISSTPSTESKPGTVTVVWDSGLEGKYRCGPKGSFDLRIVNNDATGVVHPGFLCDEKDCWSHDIRGIRWKCSECNINLCTACFLKEIPHNRDHRRFKRYRNAHPYPAIVDGWGDNGSESRMELKGIFPGAKVFSSRDWHYDKKKTVREVGLVIWDDEEDASDAILVEWPESKKTIRYKRFVDGKPSLCVQELSIGGNYHPNALPLLVIPMVTQTPILPPAFVVGDRVRIDPDLDIEEFKTKQKNIGGYYKETRKFIGATGTVLEVDDEFAVYASFTDGSDGDSFWLNPSIITKLNKFSLNQIIRIRDDQETILQIENEFSTFRTNEEDEKMEGALGRVTKVDEADPEKLYLLFDNEKIYKWLYKGNPLPSIWMEPFEIAKPSLDQELVELAAKQMALFFEAVKQGDLRIAKLLHKNYGVDVDALDEDTNNTALQLACREGFKDLVEWFLDEAQAELEKPGHNGCRALYSAVAGNQHGILEILFEKGVQLDSQNDLGWTALHLAVSKQFTECIRLMVHHGCDVNLQNASGNTPLHHAILYGRTLKTIQLLTSCSRINWNLRNKRGFKVLHLAVAKGDLKTIDLVLNNGDKDLAMELMDDGCTVLHYACNQRNFQVAKLLVNHLQQRNQLSPAVEGMVITSEGKSQAGSRLESFLEAKDKSGMTALLIASNNWNFATVDLLVEAGADATATDSDGDNALIFIAYSNPREIVSPTEDQAPSIIKFYQNIEERSLRKKMKQHPILFPILYLIEKGCKWDASNKNKETASDILKESGHQKDVIDLISQFAAEKKTKSSNSVTPVCMGEKSECKQSSNFKLSCPHKGIKTLCAKCFLSSIEKLKCGCPGETIEPTTVENSYNSKGNALAGGQSIALQPKAAEEDNAGNSSQDNKAKDKENLSGHDFKWKKSTSDQAEFAFIEDQFGFKYDRFEQIRGLHEMITSYRCEAAENGCPSIVRRIVNIENGKDVFRVDCDHIHPGGKRKRDSTNLEGSLAEPVFKREKMN